MVRSRLIDRQLTKDKDKMKRTQKILLLGSGESGKSTFLKQMRIINGRSFENQELKAFRQAVYENVVRGMKVLVDAHRKLKIPLERDEESRPLADFVFGFDNNIRLDEPVFLQYVPAITQLWTDAGIQRTFDRRNEYQLIDSVKYFFDNLDRIGQANYVPTNQDILHSRKATKCIVEHEFVIHGKLFLFVDVGGQRSQRQKWYQCFDGVKSILFLVSSSEFDQALYEDRQTNRLVESCDIFDAIVNNKAFTKVSIILFLNKTDLLAEKIKRVCIKETFPQFTGDPRSLSDVQKFMLEMFNQRRTSRSKPLFHHFTTAVDTENINVVFEAVRNTILQENLNTVFLQ